MSDIVIQTILIAAAIFGVALMWTLGYLKGRHDARR